MPSAWQRASWATVTALMACLPLDASKLRITHTSTNDLAESVLHDLLSTPLGKAMPPVRWEFFLIDDRHVSASSDGHGKIFVTPGMAWFLGDVRGVWAAVLGHEIGHALILNPAYWPRFQAALNDAYSTGSTSHNSKLAEWPRLAILADGASFNVGRPKEREYAADYIALLMMAEAGYHPDFALTLDHWMGRSMAEVPGFGLFARHPRWHVREERSTKYSATALRIFNSRWPDPARSPGGQPLPAGNIAEFTVSQNGGELVLHVAVNVHKASGAQLRVAAVFVQKRRLVPTTVQEYRSSNGSLTANAFLPDSSNATQEISFGIPVNAFATSQRKLKALVFLMAGGAVIDAASKPAVLRRPQS